ncbi:MAG: hypothetical protein WC631_02510 [Candidatus Paceibacterota bacterium]|jgi:hypothetical protein
MFEQDENKKDKIEEVKEALYSQNVDAVVAKRRHDLKPRIERVSTDWSNTDLNKESDFKFPFTKILLGTFIFFVLAAGFATFKFFAGGNLISGDNIDILIRGPVSVAGGDTLPLDIEVQNKNNVNLQVVDLKIAYPDGTRSPDDLSTPLTRYSEVLGDINVGKSERRLIKAVIFGEENTQRDIKLTVEYRVPGSNAIFYKEKTYTVLVSSAPVNLKVTGVDEINSNQKLDFNVEISSNSLSVIKNLMLKADYPFGFDFISASPQASSLDSSVWNIGDLSPGEKRIVKISGKVQGQDGEQRVFKFTVGTPDKLDTRSIGTIFSAYSSTVSIKKPFIGINLAINGNNAREVAIQSGQQTRADIYWQNNLPSQVYDVSVQIKLRGGILNKSSIQVQNGFYNSLDNLITFDKTSNESLASIAPGAGGELSFNFSSFSSQTKTGSAFTNPDIYMDVSVIGKRVQGASVPQELLYSDSKRVKIISDIRIVSNGYRSMGPFENSGPIPPKAEQETTYTIIWTVTDSLNDVGGVKVTGQLPNYIKWNNLTSPSSEDISFDQESGRVIWNIGNIGAGAGFTSPSREVSFNVSITPSLSQVGSEPSLIENVELSGTDTFTNTIVGADGATVTTGTKSDPEYSSDSGKVVK